MLDTELTPAKTPFKSTDRQRDVNGPAEECEPSARRSLGKSL